MESRKRNQKTCDFGRKNGRKIKKKMIKKKKKMIKVKKKMIKIKKKMIKIKIIKIVLIVKM